MWKALVYSYRFSNISPVTLPFHSLVFWLNLGHLNFFPYHSPFKRKNCLEVVTACTLWLTACRARFEKKKNTGGLSLRLSTFLFFKLEVISLPSLLLNRADVSTCLIMHMPWPSVSYDIWRSFGTTNEIMVTALWMKFAFFLMCICHSVADCSGHFDWGFCPTWSPAI